MIHREGAPYNMVLDHYKPNLWWIFFHLTTNFVTFHLVHFPIPICGPWSPYAIYMYLTCPISHNTLSTMNGLH